MSERRPESGTTALEPWCLLLDQRDRPHTLIRFSGLPDRAICLHEPQCEAYLQPIDLRAFRLAPEQHSPEPWAIARHGDRMAFATIYIGGTRHMVAECSVRDAELIAAAPALLRACRKALSALRSTEHAALVEELEHTVALAGADK